MLVSRAEERANTILLRIFGLDLFLKLYHEHQNKMELLVKEIQEDLQYIADNGIVPKSLIYPYGKDGLEKEGVFGGILRIKEKTGSA